MWLFKHGLHDCPSLIASRNFPVLGLSILLRALQFVLDSQPRTHHHEEHREIGTYTALTDPVPRIIRQPHETRVSCLERDFVFSAFPDLNQ